MALPVEYLPPKSRWDVMKASVPPGTPLALTWTVVDSGRLVHRGAEETEEAYDAYTAMVDDALLQPAQAEITASWRREGGSVNVIATLKNNSTVQLSADNKAGIHAIVKEPGTNYSTHTTIHPGLNAAVTAIPDLAPGETGTFYITVPDLHPTDWDNLEIIVLADYLTAPDGPYNQLQAAFAQQSLEPATLFAEPNSFYFMLGASETAVPQVTTTISGVPGVTWTASVDSPWLSIDHATGTVGQAITLVADATILTPGWNTATILVIDDTGASHTGITMTIYKASVGEDIFRIFLPLIRNP